MFDIIIFKEETVAVVKCRSDRKTCKKWKKKKNWL